MTETLAHGFSSETTQWELSNDDQQDCPGLDSFQKIFTSLSFGGK